MFNLATYYLFDLLEQFNTVDEEIVIWRLLTKPEFCPSVVSEVEYAGFDSKPNLARQTLRSVPRYNNRSLIPSQVSRQGNRYVSTLGLTSAV